MRIERDELDGKNEEEEERVTDKREQTQTYQKVNHKRAIKGWLTASLFWLGSSIHKARPEGVMSERCVAIER